MRGHDLIRTRRERSELRALVSGLLLATPLLVAPWLGACSKSATPTADPCANCEAPNFCAAGQCREPGESVVSGGLGTAAGEFGALESDESMPEAPMSIAISANGERVAVLDQVNARIQVFDQGTPSYQIPLESETADDILLLADERYAVIDRVADRLEIVSKSGERLLATSLTGDGVSEAGAIWNSFARTDGIWLAAGKLFVRIVDGDGAVLERRTLRTGLPSVDGAWLYTVRTLQDRSVEIVRRAAQGKPNYLQKQIVFDDPAQVLVRSDLDAAGRLYLISELAVEGKDPELRALVLDETLEVAREVALASDKSARQSFKTVVVSEKGVLAQLDVSADQVRVRRY